MEIQFDLFDNTQNDILGAKDYLHFNDFLKNSDCMAHLSGYSLPLQKSHSHQPGQGGSTCLETNSNRGKNLETFHQRPIFPAWQLG